MKQVLTLFILTNFIISFSQNTQNCWPLFRGDNQFLGTTRCKIPESFSLKWIVKTKEQIKSSPIICINNIFIATGSGSVICLDKEGKEVWKTNKKVTFEAPPLLFDNAIFVGSLEGEFYALDTKTGNEIWKKSPNDQIIGSANWFMKGKDAKLVFGCYDNNIYCLDPKTGNRNWSYETGNYINGAPTISDGRIVFGGCDAFLHVINTNGDLIKKIDLGTYIASSAAMLDNNAYLGNYDGEFMSVSIDKGKLNWRILLNEEASVISSPSIIDNKIIIGSRDQRVHCLDAKTGKKIWSFKTQGNVDSSPIVDQKRVLVCSFDGRVYILNIETGKEIFSFDLGSPISGTPAIVDGLIVVAAENGNIYGFKY